MLIESRYSINDVVHLVGRECPKEWVKCSACDGEGLVTLKDGKPRLCPECYGNCGGMECKPQRWMSTKTLTIGEVRATISNLKKTGTFDNYGEYGGEETTTMTFEYMAYETGIGSGTLWPEDRLFATHEEALAECERLNSLAPVEGR